ncbi:hypothetical protein ACS0TY_011149 [Phlomoides rotata]
MESLVQRAWRMVEEAAGTRFTKGQPRAGSGCKILWESPPPGMIKLNTDAVVFGDGTVGYGCVVRDDRGEVLLAGAKRELGGGSSMLVEARALLYGLETTAAGGQQVWQVESDSELLIRVINGDYEGEIYVMAVVHCIRRLASCLGILRFRAISRLANKLAHNLAQFCKHNSENLVWVEEVPPSCFSFLREDVRQVPVSGVK